MDRAQRAAHSQYIKLVRGDEYVELPMTELVDKQARGRFQNTADRRLTGRLAAHIMCLLPGLEEAVLRALRTCGRKALGAADEICSERA